MQQLKSSESNFPPSNKLRNNLRTLNAKENRNDCIWMKDMGDKIRERVICFWRKCHLFYSNASIFYDKCEAYPKSSKSKTINHLAIFSSRRWQYVSDNGTKLTNFLEERHVYFFHAICGYLSWVIQIENTFDRLYLFLLSVLCVDMVHLWDSFAFIYDRWTKYELKPSFLPLAFGVQFFLNTDTQILLLGISYID